MQFPYYCKPGRVTVKYVDVGQGWVKTNEFSYHGAVQQDADVKFITEQDGTGKILAKFNSAILKCDGISSMKRKTCTIPRTLSPWSGTITVEIGQHPGTRFLMSGTLGMYLWVLLQHCVSLIFWDWFSKYCQFSYLTVLLICHAVCLNPGFQGYNCDKGKRNNSSRESWILNLDCNLVEFSANHRRRLDKFPASFCQSKLTLSTKHVSRKFSRTQ